MDQQTTNLLSIDLGTTACKAVVVSADGRLLGESVRDYPLLKRSPQQIEQHAQDWWRVASITARHAIAESRSPGRSIRAVSVSSQGIAIVPVDEAGEVLRPAISWLDTRAGAETEEMLDHISRQETFKITGKRVNPFYSLPKMMWLAKHEPEIVKQTHKFLLPHDYLIYRLTGCHVTDHSLASGTLAHDVSELKWSRRMLDIAGISEDKLPSPVWAGTPVCSILGDSAETLGVSREAVVVCGGQDQKCASLGAGAKQGTVTVSLGTASAISAVTSHPALDSKMRLPCFPFVVPCTWGLEGVISTAGGALKWYKEAFFSGDYPLLDSLAWSAFDGTRSLFFYPHLTGAGSPIWDPDMPGMLYGISLSTEAGDVARAVLEGIAYQIRSNVEAMAELGVEVDCVKIFGGGAKSELWLQVIADILGREVRVPRSPEAAAIGACILAGVGSGLYGNAEVGAAVFAHGERAIDPDPIRAREYDERYARYRSVEARLAVP